MAEKYKNKYRIPSARLKNWDYRNDGAYFITICTKNRKHFFGEVKDGKMELSDVGKLAHQYWAEIPEHFPFVELDAFVIMPNHMHGILVVKTLHCNVFDDNDTDADTNADDVYDGTGVDMDDDMDVNDDMDVDTDAGVDAGVGPVKTLQCNVSSRSPHDTTAPLHNANPTNNIMRNISPKPGSISTIIRSYKSVTTKNARKINANFGWQPRFYDHIIRNHRAFINIHNYIINNPQKWEDDKFFKGQ